MPNQVYMTIYANGNPLTHPIVFEKGDPVSSVYELGHEVLYLGQKQFFERDIIRVHKPLHFVMPLEKTTPQLMAYLLKGDTAEKILINWFQYNEKTKKEEEYFRHLFENVTFEQLKIFLPDVKAPEYEKFNHMAEISFRYKRVTWTYLQGNLIFSDEWQSSIDEVLEDTEEEEPTSQTPAAKPEEEAVAPVQQAQPAGKKVKLSDAKFLPEEGKTDFKGKCKVTANIEFLQETTKKKILFKLFSVYKDKIQDMQHEAEGFEQNGKADGTVTLFYNDDYFADKQKPSDATVEYFLKVSHPEADEIESERIKLPYRKPLTCQFVEIPDVLFNHNSSVPLLGDKDQLIDAICTTYVFSKDNSSKELTVYGHTDTSGEDAYNMELSELRAKAIKALLDKDRTAFCDVVSKKDKIEDIQGYLKYVSTILCWDCDPGVIDNQDGPKTQQALKNFQNEYNEVFGKSIKIDGKAGPESWGAIFDIVWNVIQMRISKLCSGDNAPKLTYSGKGIIACGEKYPLEGKSKANYKSKTNRRVELIFSEKGIVIYPEPQKPDNPDEEKPEPNQDVILEPVEPEVPVVNITGVKYWCSHESSKKTQRLAKNGEVLEIVPPMAGDKITFKASSKDKNLQVKWSLSGYKKDSLDGIETHSKISGFDSQIKDIFLRLVMGELKNFAKPKIVQVSAIDESGKQLYGKLAVYPNTKMTYELDLSKITKRFKDIKEKFSKPFEWSGLECEFNVFVGKISFSGNYAEDEFSRFAYYAFEVSGGFSPLVGLSLKKEFSLTGIFSLIPKPIRKYIADICAVLTIKGQLDLKMSFARTAIKKLSAAGGISGQIGVGVGLSAQIGNGKILEIKAMISSGITGSAKVTGDSENFEKYSLGFSGIKVEWDGLKGELSWELFDGTFGSNQEIVICQSEVIWSSPEKVLLEG